MSRREQKLLMGIVVHVALGVVLLTTPGVYPYLRPAAYVLFGIAALIFFRAFLVSRKNSHTGQ